MISDILTTSIRLRRGRSSNPLLKREEGVFADDVVVMGRSENNLRGNLEVRNKTMKECQMKINKNKTKVIVIVEENTDINIKEQQ